MRTILVVVALVAAYWYFSNKGGGDSFAKFHMPLAQNIAGGNPSSA